MAKAAPDIALVWVGRTSAEYARIGLEDYLRRIRRYRSCEEVTVAEERSTGRYSKEHRLEREGEAILDALEDLGAVWVVAVDPRGRQLGSKEFAELVRRQCYDDARKLAFVVGGPDGLAPAVRKRADLVLGLGHMTMAHDLARLVLGEQLYRAFTLIHSHPYAR